MKKFESIASLEFPKTLPHKSFVEAAIEKALQLEKEPR